VSNTLSAPSEDVRNIAAHPAVLDVVESHTEPSTSSPVAPPERDNSSRVERPPLASVNCSGSPSIPFKKVSPVVAAVREFLKPVEEETPSKKSKKVTTARMITSAEFSKEVEEKERFKKKREEEKLRRQEERKLKRDQNKSTAPAKRTKKKTTKDSTKENRPPKPRVVRKKQRPPPPSSSSEDVDEPDSSKDSDSDVPSEDNTLCGTCTKSFQKDFLGESWIRCVSCGDWYHNKCQNLREDEYRADFKCDECVPLGDG